MLLARLEYFLQCEFVAIACVAVLAIAALLAWAIISCIRDEESN